MEMENTDTNRDACASPAASVEPAAAPDAPPSTADTAPSTPPSIAHSDVSEPVKKTRKKRRQAVTTEEDIAILRAIAVIKPHSVEWGHTRKSWQQVVQHVVAEVGGDEVTPMLCQRRYEILVSRFVVQQELGRLWPPNPQLHELLVAAVEEKKNREKRKKKDGDIVPKSEKIESSERVVTPCPTPAIVERIGDFHEDDATTKTCKHEAFNEAKVEELKREVATLTARLVAVEDEKVQRTDALAGLMAAQSQCQNENKALRKDVASLQMMLRDVSSLAGTLQTLRMRLEHQEATAQARVIEQNGCMQRIIMENDEQQRRIQELEAALRAPALASERDHRELLEDAVKKLTNKGTQ